MQLPAAYVAPELAAGRLVTILANWDQPLLDFLSLLSQPTADATPAEGTGRFPPRGLPRRPGGAESNFSVPRVTHTPRSAVEMSEQGSWLCKNTAASKRGRTNVRPNHRQVRKNSQASLISIGPRKIILISFQFPAFLHSLGVIHDRGVQYPCRSMSVVTPMAILSLGAAK